MTTAKVTCRPFLGPVLLNVAEENGRRSLVTGGCDIGRSTGSRGDLYLDAGEDVIYQVGFANQNQSSPIDVEATLSCLDPSPGGANPCAYLSIVAPEADLGTIPPGREGIGSWTIRVAPGVTGLATSDRAVDLKVTFASRSTDFGGQLAAQSFVFREALQADVQLLRYNTDFPAGGTQAADYSKDGIIASNPAGSPARNRELETFGALNNSGNPNQAAAAQMPWHFDLGNGGFTAFRTADSKPGPSPQNALAWFYSTSGGCGWQTQNNGVVGSGAGLPKGTWHAGQGPIGSECVPFVHPARRSQHLAGGRVHPRRAGLSGPQQGEPGARRARDAIRPPDGGSGLERVVLSEGLEGRHQPRGGRQHR